MLFSRYVTFVVILAFAMVINVAMAFPTFISSTQYVPWNPSNIGWDSVYNCRTFNQYPLFYSGNQIFYEFGNTRYYIQGSNLSPTACLPYPADTWNPFNYNGNTAWSWNNNLKAYYQGGWKLFY